MLLVSYCSVTNYHTYSGLKTHTHLLCSGFHGWENWVWGSEFYNSTTNALARMCSFLELGALLSVVRFLSIMIVGLTEAPFSFWLSIKDHTHLLSLSLPCYMVLSQHDSFKASRAIASPSNKEVLYEVSYPRLLMVFVISYWLAASQRFCSHSRKECVWGWGGDCTKAWPLWVTPGSAKLGERSPGVVIWIYSPHTYACTYRQTTPQDHPTWHLSHMFSFQLPVKLCMAETSKILKAVINKHHLLP